MPDLLAEMIDIGRLVRWGLLVFRFLQHDQQIGPQNLQEQVV